MASAAKRLAWHYTATLTGTIESHENYWKDHHDWDRGGYHFYIDRKGRIFWNYDYTRITWGVANNNHDTVHISLESDTADNYTEEQIKAREWLTRKVMKDLSIPTSNVMGHWEVYNNTSCPGYTRSEMNNFRNQLAAAKPTETTNSVHVVKSGDTLYALSKKYGMSVDAIKELNGLDSNLIVVGQSLKFTGNPTTSKPILKDLDVIAKEVIDGKWKNFPERQKLLAAAGYDYHDVQTIVDRLQKANNLLTLEAVAREVIEGKWGNGDDRKNRLQKAGYNYADVQAEVDSTLEANTPKPFAKKTYVQLAKHEPLWRAYRLGSKPVAGNEVGFLAPRQYGGLEYEILGYENNNTCAIIQTQAFGKVKIFIKDPSAKIVTK
ncbi:MAG TPA: N-acetylmuramoyl-L-alanine amidase [Sporosarcina psychrophila]|uniref:N-acetylmuramoyl-L-alanine amidase n=1 Tax=Sporosarcina psychrophila TaxID=1476 RepID=A0A921FVS9_SPOPS|nr:N-acetylmuramoyl-L-alanine amidase [Sporosarcina psychrophila]